MSSSSSSSKSRATNSGPSPTQLNEIQVGNVATGNVQRNERGGINVTFDEINRAFQFFDTDNSGKVNINTLRKRLINLFPEITTKELRFLMNNKRELVAEDIFDLLKDNEITNFDPVAEAFKIYDPSQSGYASKEALQDIFRSFGFGELNNEEMAMVMKVISIYNFT
jgi:Ca2+-binding EF-hand superfamily protein